VRAGSEGGRPVLLLFLDGVGLGHPDPEVNPFFAARLPFLESLLAGSLPHLDHPEVSTADSAAAFPLDPLLGVEGLPQSGTGQAALLTGENAPAIYGRHFGPWVPARLRPLLAERNILSVAKRAGVPCAFANAYPSFYSQTPWAKRPAGPPLAAQAAGLFTRTEDELACGEAVSSEIVNTAWRDRSEFSHLPDISAEEAGRKLARIASGAGLTLFAHYATDFAGHTRSVLSGAQALERVDAFLGGLVPALPPDTLVVVASDHGNLEDATMGHTLNPTLCLLVGAGAPALREGLSSITDLPDMIFRVLGIGS